MLFSTALRLAAVECLAPTAAIVADTGFPTLAGPNVFDNRLVTVADLRAASAQELIALSVHSGAASSARRGQASSFADREARATLFIAAEIAVLHRGDGEFADAKAETDADSAILLDALAAQVRSIFEAAPAGGLFRQVSKGAPISVTVEPDYMPETGIRFARRFITIECDCFDDDYSTSGGLPEPLASLRLALPATSYAKKRLDGLASAFGGWVDPALARVDIATGIADGDGVIGAGETFGG